MLMRKGEWPSNRILCMGLFKELLGYEHYSKIYKIRFLCEYNAGIWYSGGIAPRLLDLGPGWAWVLNVNVLASLSQGKALSTLWIGYTIVLKQKMLPVMCNNVAKYSITNFKSKLLKSTYVLISSILPCAFRIAGSQ